MKGCLRTFLPFLLLFTICIYSNIAIYNLHDKKKTEIISYLATFPESLARAVILEFPGIASDHLMLKVLTYLGQLLIDNSTPSREEWSAVYLTLKQCINLDPSFLDPYVLAQMTLPSDAGMVKETNDLLERGAKVLINDYRPHFFLWHNYSSYLNDPLSAAKHLEQAARMPGAPSYFSTLAARTQLYAGNIYAAVIFLEETLKETQDSSIRSFLSMRLEALKRIGFLEVKIQEYKKRHNKSPGDLKDLIDGGIITRIPSDPYGGHFYVMDNGRVYTTSKLVLLRKSGQE